MMAGLYNRVMFMKYLLCLAVIFLPQLSGADDGMELLGLKLPSLLTESWILGENIVPYAPFPMKFDLLFYLSSEGTVDSFVCLNDSSSVFIERMARSLESLVFSPAQKGGLPTTFIQKGEMIFRSTRGKTTVELLFPGDEIAGDRNHSEIVRTLEINGVAIPKLVRFPSYYCAFPPEADESDYQYAVYEVLVDSSGELADFSLIKSTMTSCSMKIGNALLYADFNPAGIEGKRFESRFFVIIRLFKRVNYPTMIWPAGNERSAVLPFDYCRIESRLFLDSIINPPFPVNVPGGAFRLDAPAQLADTFETEVVIDTAGRIRSWRILDYVPEVLSELTGDLLEELIFLPARDAGDRLVDFKGRLLLMLDAGRNLRIISKWLPDEAQSN